MFGDRYLVDPVLEAGVSVREVYLPEGVSWKNVRDGSVTEGGRMIEALAPLDVIPVFERV